MHDITDSPFRCMEEALKHIDADIVLVDLHAEATSEKIAFAYAFAGRISAVVGTHTHVQTADERIVNGTAAISDLGMCGSRSARKENDRLNCTEILDELLDRDR